MKSFLVSYKDLVDPEKNPTGSLSPRDILDNPKIPKKEFKPKEEKNEHTKSNRVSD